MGVFFFNLVGFVLMLEFWFRNTNNEKAAPLFWNAFCSVIRAHGDWPYFLSKEPLAQRCTWLAQDFFFNRQQEALALPYVLDQAAS